MMESEDIELSFELLDGTPDFGTEAVNAAGESFTSAEGERREREKREREERERE